MDPFPVITGQLSGFGADIYLETMDRCPIIHRIHFHSTGKQSNYRMDGNPVDGNPDLFRNGGDIQL